MNRLNVLICYVPKNVVINGARGYAGHSKWQNIKATKQEQDTARSKLFQTLITKMTAVISETGNADPERNSKLASIIDQAKKVNMPASTINSFLERTKHSQPGDQRHVMPVRTSAGCTLILYISTNNLTLLKINLNTLFRKHNAKPAETALSMFDCASYIIASKDCNLDQAMEDAIQVEAEDVEEVKNGDKTYFKFKCEFLFPDKVKTKLTNLSYSIISIEDACIPSTLIELSNQQLEGVNKFKNKLLELNGVEKIEDNIA